MKKLSVVSVKSLIVACCVFCIASLVAASAWTESAVAATEWRNPDREVAQAFKQAQRYYEEKDYKNAALLYHEAAKVGNSVAQNNLGMMYILGEGVPQDIELGKEWLRKSAAKGNEAAKTNLAAVEQRQRQSSSGRVQQDNSKWFGLAVFAGGMLLLFDQMDKNRGCIRLGLDLTP